MQYQNAQTVLLPTTDSYDLQAQKNEHNVISMINLFHNNIKCGPEYICTCCDHLWYKSSVVKCDVNKYKVCSQDLFKSCITGLKSVDNTEWICTTCDLNLKKGRLPSCSKANKMSFPKKPELLNLTPLEEQLVSPCISFMQIHELPRGGQLTIHGNIVNVPSDVNSSVHCLSRLMNESQTIPIKLKRRLSYQHHYQFQNVRPKKVLDAVKYLVGTHDLFKHEGMEVQNSWLDDTNSQCSGHEDWTEDYRYLSKLMHLDEGFRVLKNLRGSPPYFEKCKKDLFAMICQLGTPTWFCSFSAAETRWTHLLKTLGRIVEKKEYTVNEIKHMTWEQKSNLIQKDPVTCARNFEHMVQYYSSMMS